MDADGPAIASRLLRCLLRRKELTQPAISEAKSQPVVYTPVATQIGGASSSCPAGEYLVDFPMKTGAGEGIRTLDPNLGKSRPMLLRGSPSYATA